MIAHSIPVSLLHAIRNHQEILSIKLTGTLATPSAAQVSSSLKILPSVALFPATNNSILHLLYLQHYEVSLGVRRNSSIDFIYSMHRSPMLHRVLSPLYSSKCLFYKLRVKLCRKDRHK